MRFFVGEKERDAFARAIICCYHSFVDGIDRAKQPGSVQKASKMERYRQERVAATAGAPHGLDVANDDLYVLIEVEELKYQLEVKHR